MLDWLKQRQGKAVFAVQDRLYAPDPQRPLPFVYPVYDHSKSADLFEKLYGYLPAESVPGLGSTVYHVDYGNARILFLRSDAMGQQQITWARQLLGAGAKPHKVVLFHDEPAAGQANLWKLLREAGVELVIVGENVYARERAIVQEPSDFAPSPHEGYGRWTPGLSMEESQMLMLDYSEKGMAIKAMTPGEQVLDQMELNPKDAAAQRSREWVAVGIQQEWKYHLADPAMKAVIPQGFDVTGENPITTPFHLPADDWRSPAYLDADWKSGNAPLGFTNRRGEESKLNTRLKADPESPSYYFRRAFTLADKPKDMRDLILRLSYEDGLIVYLNGEEVFRDGIRTGLILPSSLAITNQAVWYRTVSLQNHIGKLRAGSNTLAVEVHRSHPGSPNFLFDLSLSYIR
ncbi:metallophosphoesterase family protein [Brevibacillus choshinensis]|uniref:Uncharacterized protein n=1 Tax=Brevibacillus choshinensis TaxID=54911 RepID=A0ABX7FK06_BRECH|nr:hypothetical protein [Brevibacillus choshinensis]QRG66538.1 hypothetical protein JNE38_23940 [Brevibacillus choshinensis]